MFSWDDIEDRWLAEFKQMVETYQRELRVLRNVGISSSFIEGIKFQGDRLVKHVASYSSYGQWDGELSFWNPEPLGLVKERLIRLLGDHMSVFKKGENKLVIGINDPNNHEKLMEEKLAVQKDIYYQEFRQWRHKNLSYIKKKTQEGELSKEVLARAEDRMRELVGKIHKVLN